MGLAVLPQLWFSTVSFLQLLFPGNINLSKKSVESVSSYKSVRVRPAQFVGEEALGRL